MTWVEFRVMELSTKYILERENRVANQLSHDDWVNLMGWSLLPQGFEVICWVYGKLVVDLFTT